MTGEVVLRDVILEDLPILYEHQLDPEAARMTAFTPRNREAFLQHWARILADKTVLTKTILFNGQVAGNIGSYQQSGKREVGYWIGREYWGRGIATLALDALLALDRERPIYAHVAKHNLASRRVLEKCGFRIYGEDRMPPNNNGEVIEEYILKLDSLG